MVLIRILVGFIAAILKALAGAFLAIFSSAALAITAVVVLVAIVFGICGFCGFGFFARNR